MIETLNLIKAKKLAMDVEWLAKETTARFGAAIQPVRNRVLEHIDVTTGFSSLERFLLGATQKEKSELLPAILCALVANDFEGLSHAQRQDAEHSQVVDLITQVLKSPDLLAKIEVNIHLKK